MRCKNQNAMDKSKSKVLEFMNSYLHTLSYPLNITFSNSFKVLTIRRCGRVSGSAFECLLSATIVGKHSMSDATRFLVPLKYWAGERRDTLPYIKLQSDMGVRRLKHLQFFMP